MKSPFYPGKKFKENADQRGPYTSNASEDNSGDKTFSCTFCNVKLTKAISLKHHISAVHEKKRCYTCKQCSQAFYYQTSLHRHMKIQHTEANKAEYILKENCNVCKEDFWNEFKCIIGAPSVSSATSFADCDENWEIVQLGMIENINCILSKKKMRQENSETKMGKGCSIRAKRERERWVFFLGQQCCWVTGSG